MQRFYHEREFLEARIAARRTAVPTGQSGVALEYDIERGPQTKLTIDGHPLPGAVVERMEDAWVWAVFDDFLLDDLAAMAKESLTGDGYLRADVQALVVSEPDAALKEIAVRIDPGTRFTDRRIVFSGQQALSASTLETLIRTRALDASSWQDPSALQAAVEQQYRLRGYLDASAKVQPPVFNGRSAELPVQISEGRQYTVARLDVQGAQARSRDQIAAAFGVAAGSPYQPAALEPARRAVEVDYLRDGYNNVRVTVTPAIDAARGSVDLVLVVDEGVQQVLAGLDIKGADITRRGVIDRALDVEIGQPVNQAEFFRAETRLYDTSAFRTADIALVPFETDQSGRIERVRAEVTLQELAPYRLRYGFRVNDTITPVEFDRELRPALVVDFLRRNLFGQAISAGAAAQIEADRRLLRGVLSLPRFFGLPVTTNLFATKSREDFTPEGATPFVEDESGITVEQRFALSPKMGVTYGYDYSRSHIFEPDPLPGIPPLELQAKVARLTGTYAWDRRNDPIAPQDGWFHSSGVELGTKILGLGFALRPIPGAAALLPAGASPPRAGVGREARVWPRVRTGSDSQRALLRRRRHEREGLRRRQPRRRRCLRRRQGRERHADSQPGSADVPVRMGARRRVRGCRQHLSQGQRLLAHGPSSGRRRRHPHQFAVCPAANRFRRAADEPSKPNHGPVVLRHRTRFLTQ